MTENQTNADLRIFLGMPAHGTVTPHSAMGFWNATENRDAVRFQCAEGSLLAQTFNRLWCSALNMKKAGFPIDYFAMQHADIEPEIYWLDQMLAEMESQKLDILGAVVPIKDDRGVTSIALNNPGDTWNPLCRLTMQEVYRLPATFTSEDVGHPILLNTGLWICRFDWSWITKVRFTVNDKIVFDKTLGMYLPLSEPEDWYFSRLCHELGLRVGATRKVNLTHRGPKKFPNFQPWGADFDSQYINESVVPIVTSEGFRFPHDVDGWLSYDEGKALAELARGKRVLEIGSYCGRSTICLAQTGESVFAVDPHDGRGTPRPRHTRAEFESNLERYGVADKVSIHADTCDAETAGFALVFIDGAHDYESVTADIKCSLPLLADGGLLAFHDYRQFPGQYDGRWDEGVTKAVDELLRSGGEMLSTHDSLAVVRPPAAIPLEVSNG